MPLGNWSTNPYIPPGGSTGDVLTKNSAGDHDTIWAAPGAGSGDVTKDELAGATLVTTIADTEHIPISVAGSPNSIKKIVWTAFKALIDAIYVPITRTVNSKALSSNITLTQDDVGNGSTYKQYSSTEKSKLSGIEASADVTDLTNVSSSINSASAATPVDTDKFPFIDVSDSNTIKTVTGANLKTYIGASAGMDIHGLSAETTIEDADELPFYDNSASANKKITFANFWLKVKGLVSSFVFPVGRVVMFDNATSDPNTLYGNTWSRVDGGFVGMYKSGDANFGTAGAAVTGGAKTKNMEHDHVVPAVPAYCQPAGSPGYPMWTTPTGKALSTTQDVLNPGWVLCVWRRTA